MLGGGVGSASAHAYSSLIYDIDGDSVIVVGDNVGIVVIVGVVIVIVVIVDVGAVLSLKIQ